MYDIVCLFAFDLYMYMHLFVHILSGYFQLRNCVCVHLHLYQCVCVYFHLCHCMCVYFSIITLLYVRVFSSMLLMCMYFYLATSLYVRIFIHMCLHLHTKEITINIVQCLLIDMFPCIFPYIVITSIKKFAVLAGRSIGSCSLFMYSLLYKLHTTKREKKKNLCPQNGRRKRRLIGIVRYINTVCCCRIV